MEDIELLVPAFQEREGGDDGNQRGSNSSSQMVATRSFKVSPQGHFYDEKNLEDIKLKAGGDAPSSNYVEDAGMGVGGTIHQLEDTIDNSFAKMEPLAKQAKSVNVGQDVLNIYHDSYLYGTYPLTTRVRTILRSRPVALVLRTMEFVASAVSVSIYVASTSMVDRWPKSLRLSLEAGNMYFVADYFVKLYSAPVGLSYAFSWSGMLDLVTSLYVIFYFSNNQNAGAITQILLFIRLLRPVGDLKSMGLVKSAIVQECLLLFVYLLGIVFVAAGIFQWVEKIALSQSELTELGCPAIGCFNFYDALYFVVVTVSTVGYGDITPNTSWGRLIVILIIVTTLVIIPVQINKILDVASRSPYGGRALAHHLLNSRYLIFCGNISYRTMTDFLYAVYHPDHDADLVAYPLRVTIMVPYKPTFEMKCLLSLYNGHVDFMEGSPLNRDDLNRANARCATAIYVLGNTYNKDGEADDSSQMVQALSIRRYCGHSVRIIVEVTDPATAHSAVWDEMGMTNDVVCPEAFHYKLLASSCHIKGITTFITNLFRPGLYVIRPLYNHFMFEYYHGHLQEIFPVLLPDAFCGMHFEEVAEFCYFQFNVTLFALDVVLDKSRRVFLFPHGHIIGSMDMGLVIADNIRTAEMVSNFKEKQKNWMGLEGWYSFCTTLPTLHNRPHHSQNHNARLSSRLWHSQAINSLQQVRQKWRKADKVSDLHKHETEMSLLNYHTEKVGEVSKSQLAMHLERASRLLADRNSEAGSDKKECERSSELGGEGIKKMSIEDAVEKLLTWPPPILQERPHLAILSRKHSRIEEHLAANTLPVVQLGKPHILVCVTKTWPFNLYHFVSHLRKGLFPESPIVFLCKTHPTTEEWGCLGIFEEVYFVSGSPMHELTLMRAGVVQAAKVLILCGDGYPENSDEGGELGSAADMAVEDHGGDADNLVIAANVERLVGSGERLVVELQHELAFQYLRPKWVLQRHDLSRTTYLRNRESVNLFCPAYQSGKAFCPAGLSFITYANFYNRNVSDIVEQLLTGGPVDGPQIRKNNNERSRQLQQIWVPVEYNGRTYGDLVAHLLHERGMLALGLFRAEGTKGAPVPFVHTNPSRDTVVTARDLVFVLM